MDPVALQFLTELDAADGELPSSVLSGLTMCGEDAVPGLLERLDAQKPAHQQIHAAAALARIRAPEALPGLVGALGNSENPRVTHALGDAIRGFGPALHGPALEAARDAAIFAPARVSLLGMVLLTGGDGEGVDELLAELAPSEPRVGLLLMKERPRAAWLAVIQEHKDAFGVAAPALMAQVSMACLPLARETRADQMEHVQKVLSSQEDYAAQVLAGLSKKTDDA